MGVLNTETMGEKGFPILLLHGWGHDLTHMRPLGECLSAYSQVHLIDLPGFGLSTHPGSVWDSFEYADRLIAYMDERRMTEVDVLGHSFGGKVAFSLASRYPHRVRRMVLLASTGLKRKRSWWQRGRFIAIRQGGKLVKVVDRLLRTDLFKTRFASRYGSADYKQAGAMRSILVKSVNEDLIEVLRSIQAETLLLWGKQDFETPIDVANRFHANIKGSRLILFPNKDHYLHQEVGAHLCASYILPFLQADTK